MKSEDLEHAYKLLYKQFSNQPYNPSAYWSTSRDFTTDPVLTDTKFLLNDTLVQPAGIEPTSTGLQTVAMTTSAKVA